MPNRRHFLTRFEVFQLFLIVSIVAYLSLIILIKQTPFFWTDVTISRYIQDINEPIFDSLMNFLTTLGDPLWFIITSIGAICYLIYIKNQLAAAFLFFSITGSLTITYLFKLLVGRPRPDGNIINQVNQFYYPDSFPSGHVLEFIGLYGFLLFLSFTKIQSNTWRILVSFIFAFLVGTIGVSRIYLGAHWFTDTVGSYLIGTVWLGLVVYFYRKA